MYLDELVSTISGVFSTSPCWVSYNLGACIERFTTPAEAAKVWGACKVTTINPRPARHGFPCRLEVLIDFDEADT